LVAVTIGVPINAGCRRQMLGVGGRLLLGRGVGVFPNEADITRRRVGGAAPRYMTLETIAPMRGDLTFMPPSLAA
jgi:hypothetical protein